MPDRVTLPRNYKPSHYKLIDLDITEAAKSLVLNADELRIIRAELHDGNGDAPRVIPSTGHSHQKDDTSVTISFDEELLVANPYKLVIEYEGSLNAQSTGFYRAQYKALSEPPASVARGEDGSPCIVCTQFQPIGARRAFPCFDEPNMKATFSLGIEFPADQTAVSNTPVAATQETSKGRKRVTFATTPIMSTYLLAWAVGDFKYIETFTEQVYSGRKIPVRFYATAGLEEQGRFAIEEAAKAVDFFSTTFGIEYPLAKLDILALIFDEKTSGSAKKELIASILTHEVAHQWFGNLVTMDWWDELWLNEGFATWAGTYAVDRLHPDWRAWARFAGEGMEGALIRDALRSSSHPIQVPVPDARRVHEVFDQISYQKSCAVLSMLADYMGVDTFLSGVSVYLAQNSYANATADHLWRALGAAAGGGDDDDDDIAAKMKPWIEKIGHPVLTVTHESGQLTLTQSRFLAADDMRPEEDETTWWIPLGFRVLAGTQAPPTLPPALAERQTSVAVPEAPLYLLNGSGTGFYRVAYPKAHLARLGQRLHELSAVEKLTVLNSASALAFSGSGSVVALLGFMQAAFAGETDPQVWLRMMRDFTRLRCRFHDDAEMLPGIKALTRAVIRSTVQELGWQPVQGESHLRSDLRRTMLEAGFYCDSDEIQEAALAQDMLHETETEKRTIDPSLRYIAWGATARAAPQTAVPAMLDRWQATASTEERGRLVRGMCMAQDADVLHDLVLPFGYGGYGGGAAAAGRALRPTEMRPLVATLAQQWPARRLQWEHIKARWGDAAGALGGAPEAVSPVLSLALSGCVDEAEAADIDAFFADKNTDGYAMTLAKIRDGIMNASRFRKRERVSLAAWLQEQGYMTSQQ